MLKINYYFCEAIKQAKSTEMEVKDNADRILMFIKMRQEATLLSLAEELGMTKEGVRQHLMKLNADGLIETLNRREGVGRPTAYYRLTEKASHRFPNAHAQVTVDLLQSVKHLLGENALDLLISDREKRSYQKYEEALAEAKPIADKLEKLAQLRSVEGYMASWKQVDEHYYFIESHCPICAAATECQGFCRAELMNFKQLMGEEYEVERVEHIVAGAARCTYEISRK